MADNGDQQPSSLSNNEIMASVSDQVLSFLKRTPLIIVIMFFLLSPKQTTVLAANDQVVGGNIQPPTWLLEWLNSGDISLQKLNLQCEKVRDDNAGKGWTLRCENSPGGEGDHKSQTFFLHLDNSQNNSHPYNETGKSLCCHPCHYTPVQTVTPPEQPVTPPEPPVTLSEPPVTSPVDSSVNIITRVINKIKTRVDSSVGIITRVINKIKTPVDSSVGIITWVINKIKTSTCSCTGIVVTSISVCRRILVTSISIWRRIVVESVSELTTVVGIYIHKCQYQSETMSTEFEMELKKMLQKELLRQIEASKETCNSKTCLDIYPNALRYQFKNKFNDILITSLHEISRKTEEGSTDSADSNELITEHEQISSVERANYAEVIEHHEQISVEQLHTAEVIKHQEIIVEESAEVIKHQEIVVEESAEVIKHQEIVVEELAEVIKHQAIVVEESAEVIKHQEIFVEESAEVIKRELILPTAT